jgi:hypothetical protein
MTPVIVSRREKRGSLLLVTFGWLIIAAFFFISGVITYHYYISWISASNVQSDTLHHVQIIQCENELKSCDLELISTERLLLIEQESNRLLGLSINELLANNSELINEIEFYKRILTTDETSSALGLKIDKLTLVRKGTEPVAKIKLVILYRQSSNTNITGTIQIQIEGLKNSTGEETIVDATTNGIKFEQEFNIRYFYIVDDEIDIPEYFLPQKIIVTLLPKSKGVKKVQQTFDWVVNKI